MLKNALKFMILIPFNPMRFIKEFELVEKQRGVQRLAFLFAFLCLVGSYFLYVHMHKSDPEFFGPGIFVTFLFFKIFSIFLFMVTLLIIGFMDKLELSPSRVFALVAFTLVLDVFSVVVAVWDLNAAFYVFWLVFILKTTVLSLGVYIFGDASITKSIVITCASAVWLLVLNDLFFLG